MKRITTFFVLSALSALASSGQGITVTSPNGGESWRLGEQRPITWLASGVSGSVRIVLDRAGAKVGDIAVNIPASQQSFLWSVGSLAGGSQVAAAGGYRVRIRATGTEISDSSNADFRLTRDLHFQQQGGHDLQPSQGQGQVPGLQPGQSRPPDTSGATGMPDLAIVGAEYDHGRHRISMHVKNIGLADYAGMLNYRFETTDAGCWEKSGRLMMSQFHRDSLLILESEECDYFPSPCGHRFRMVIDPEGPDERSGNNFLATDFYRYQGFHPQPIPPLRLEFSHGSKRLECYRFVYDSSNTITRNDILNDYNPGSRTAQIRLVIGARNCGDLDVPGTLVIQLARPQIGNEEILLTAEFPPQHIPSGTEVRFETSLEIPVLPGPLYLYLAKRSGAEAPGDICKAAFKFADEFFE